MQQSMIPSLKILLWQKMKPMNGMTFWVKRHMSTKLIYNWLEFFYKDICWPFKRRCENMRFWNWWCYIYNRKKKVKNGIDYQDMDVTVSNHSIISSGVGKDFQKMILTSKLIKITYFHGQIFLQFETEQITVWRTCRELSMCYHCLENVDTDEECTAETPYNFIGLEDPENNDRRIECRKFKKIGKP